MSTKFEYDASTDKKIFFMDLEAQLGKIVSLLHDMIEEGIITTNIDPMTALEICFNTIKSGEN